MATDLKFPFVKKLILFLFGLQAILVPVAAAIKEQAGQKLPNEVIAWITVITAPWPTYTFGVLYFVILMGILMGLIIYQAIAKTKIFEEGMGGAKGGVQIGITAILTLITIKFMPFQYYIMLTAILVLIAAFLGFYTLFEAATKYGGAEGKWKNTITVIGLGLVLVLVGYFLLQTFDEFQRLGVITGPAALTTQWPGAIAWLIIIAGIIFTCGGVMYAISSVGFTSTFGGFAGSGVSVAHQLDEVTRASKWDNQEATDLRDVTGLVADASREIQSANPRRAIGLLEAAAKKIRDALRDANGVEREARRLLATANGYVAAGQHGVTAGHIRTWELGITRLTQYIEKLEELQSRLDLRAEGDLKKAVQKLASGRPAAEIEPLLRGIEAELRGMQNAHARVQQVITEINRLIGAVRDAGGARGGAAPAPPGGRMRAP